MLGMGTGMLEGGWEWDVFERVVNCSGEIGF
jgi:hypothetical protein